MDLTIHKDSKLVNLLTAQVRKERIDSGDMENVEKFTKD